MTRDRWEDVRESIEEKFEVSASGEEPLDGRPGSVEYIEFTTPAGTFRLEFVDAAKVTGIATSSGRKMGTAGRIARTFSESEYVTRLDAYRWDGTQWVAMDASAFANA